MSERLHRSRLGWISSALTLLLWVSTATASDEVHGPGERARALVESGAICRGITEPDDLVELLGEPQIRTQNEENGGLWERLRWDGVFAVFRRWPPHWGSDAITLVHLQLDEEELISHDSRIVVTDADDLAKLNRFLGLQNISVLALDLRDEGPLLETMPFDSLTRWPASERLPAGFDPDELLEEGKNPGLGLRDLHAQGIDGRGVGLAIIDQPLLLGHESYAHRLIRYDATGLGGVEPQMHGPPVASIAVGRDVGVAPAAELTYYAVAMWGPDNLVFVEALDDILRRNESLPGDQRIRVVSISTGMFASFEHPEEWEAALDRAEAAGLFVVTCDNSRFRYGLLARNLGEDPESPTSYNKIPASSHMDATVLVPGGNRTMASHRGVGVFTFDRDAGLSWGAPFVAGLAALAHQVRPGILPREIRDALAQTAVTTPTGPVVDPRAFIERVRGELPTTD